MDSKVAAPTAKTASNGATHANGNGVAGSALLGGEIFRDRAVDVKADVRVEDAGELLVALPAMDDEIPIIVESTPVPVFQTKASAPVPAPPPATPVHQGSQASQQEAHNLAGLKALEAGTVDVAYRCFSAGLALGLADKVLYNNRSAALMRLKRYQEAYTDAITCVTIDPSFYSGHIRLAEALFYLGHYGDCSRSLQNAIRHNPPARELQYVKELFEQSQQYAELQRIQAQNMPHHAYYRPAPNRQRVSVTPMVTTTTTTATPGKPDAPKVDRRVFVMRGKGTPEAPLELLDEEIIPADAPMPPLTKPIPIPSLIAELQAVAAAAAAAAAAAKPAETPTAAAKSAPEQTPSREKESVAKPKEKSPPVTTEIIVMADMSDAGDAEDGEGESGEDGGQAEPVGWVIDEEEEFDLDEPMTRKRRAAVRAKMRGRGRPKVEAATGRGSGRGRARGSSAAATRGGSARGRASRSNKGEKASSTKSETSTERTKPAGRTTATSRAASAAARGGARSRGRAPTAASSTAPAASRGRGASSTATRAPARAALRSSARKAAEGEAPAPAPAVTDMSSMSEDDKWATEVLHDEGGERVVELWEGDPPPPEDEVFGDDYLEGAPAKRLPGEAKSVVRVHSKDDMEEDSARGERTATRRADEDGKTTDKEGKVRGKRRTTLIAGREPRARRAPVRPGEESPAPEEREKTPPKRKPPTVRRAPKAAAAASTARAEEESDVSPFIQVLFEKLSEGSLGDPLYWSADGAGIMVSDRERAAKLLNTRHWTSLLSSLYNYKFQRKGGLPEDQICYFHEFFHRDKPELLRQVVPTAPHQAQFTQRSRALVDAVAARMGAGEDDEEEDGFGEDDDDAVVLGEGEEDGEDGEGDDEEDLAPEVDEDHDEPPNIPDEPNASPRKKAISDLIRDVIYGKGSSSTQKRKRDGEDDDERRSKQAKTTDGSSPAARARAAR